MARDVLSLALKITGDASGLRLTPVERALKSLEEQTKSITGQFDKFGTGSAAAARAQEQFGNQLAGLEASLKAGEITAKEFAAQFDQIRQAATAETAALERAAQITDQNRTAAERFDIAQAELKAQLDAGRISTETYSRAVDKAAKGLTDAERAARGFDKAAEGAADNSLKFNELSGIFAALPGPLGSIAGRFSGLASAGEGLSRVFAGGLKNGFASIATAATALVNPLTIAAVGFGAFAAAANAIIGTLNRVSEEVERLSLLADRTGVSFEFIQVLEVAAVKSGTSVESLGGSFNRFLRSVDDARTGSKNAEAAFLQLGISVDDLSSQNPEQLFTEAAKAISQIDDPAKRAAAAMEIFGKAGAELIPVFAELATAREELERLGTAISEKQRQDLLEYNNELDRLGIASKGAGQQLAASFAPGLADVTRAINEGIGAANRFSKEYPVVSQSLADSAVNAIPVISQLRLIGNTLGFVTDSAGQAQKAVDLEKQLEAKKQQAEEEIKALEAQQKLIDGITQELNKGIEDSAQFGQAGFDAAVQYQESIARLKEQLDAGLFNEETFRREAEKAGVAFRQELDTLEQNAQLDIQINADAEKTLAGLSAEIDKAIQRAEQFGQAGFDAALEFQNKLEALRKQFEAGIINEEVLKRGVAAANAEYDTQIDKIKQAQEEQKKLIEGDKSRIDGLLKTNDATTKIEEDLAAVTREIERVAEAQAAARDAGDQAAAGAAAARIAELDQLQAKLDDNLQAAEQGFGEAGFGPAFAQIDQQLGGLQEKALEFGAAGQAAFLRLQEGVAAAQEQARDGILNREALEQQVAAQQKAFEQELKNIDEAAKARAKAADDAVKAEERRQKEIARAQDEQQKAIEKSQEQAQQKYLEEQKKIFEERRKAEEAEFKRQEERLQKLNTLGQLSVNTSDVRTSEGAALVIDLAANAQDPRLIQERLQTKLLEKIALSLAGAAANYFNSPVAIVGAARLG